MATNPLKVTEPNLVNPRNTYTFTESLSSWYFNQKVHKNTDWLLAYSAHKNKLNLYSGMTID